MEALFKADDGSLLGADQVGELELIDFLKDRLAAYKVPKKVVFFHELPISGAGIGLKCELKDLLSKEEG